MLARLKGSILRMAILDSTGSQLSPAYESWYEPNITVDGEEREKVRKRRPVSVSPSTSQDLNESQYAVVCSEKQAKVISLPSQTCIYKHSITETSFILRADVVQMSQGVCVACFCANGHIMTLRWEPVSLYQSQSEAYWVIDRNISIKVSLNKSNWCYWIFDSFFVISGIKNHFHRKCYTWVCVGTIDYYKLYMWPCLWAYQTIFNIR